MALGKRRQRRRTLSLSLTRSRSRSAERDASSSNAEASRAGAGTGGSKAVAAWALSRSSSLSSSPVQMALDGRRSLDDTERTPRASTTTMGGPAAGASTSSSSSLRGFLTDKLHSGSQAIARAPQSLLPSRSSPSASSQQQQHHHHQQHNLIMSSSSSLPKQPHPSPSKSSFGRSNHEPSREMHRLGSLGHIPNSLTPSPGPSSSSLNLSSSATLVPPLPSTLSADNPWSSLHVLVLPLFNSDPLRIPIEDLNALVRKHIHSVVSNSPARAVATLEAETADLLASGMDTFNGKLAGVVPEDKLLGRVVDLWGFFWDQVLPYVEGVLLPLQTDPLLLALYRTPRVPRGAGDDPVKPHAPLQPAHQIDVRTLALRCFRDKIILPLSKRLHSRIAAQKQDGTIEGHTFPRLQQMLLVLVSQARKPTLSSSLADPPPAPPPGEQAVLRLLRLVRAPVPSSLAPRPTAPPPPPPPGRPLSFVSANVPRDRRGRIARRPKSLVLNEEREDGDGMGSPGAGDETPRTTAMRRPGREMLEQLRSPDRDKEREREVSGGGWGLGDGRWEDEKEREREEEETLEGEALQAQVERLVGMRPGLQTQVQASPQAGRQEVRRRMT